MTKGKSTRSKRTNKGGKREKGSRRKDKEGGVWSSKRREKQGREGSGRE